MPSYIVHKDGAFNIYTTVADGFYFDTGITEEELYDYTRSAQGEAGVDQLPESIARAVENGSSSLIGQTFEDLAECIVTGESIQECIDKYMTIPKGIKDNQKDMSEVITTKEALRICVAQLKELTSNTKVYDDNRGRSISFSELDKMIL